MIKIRHGRWCPSYPTAGGTEAGTLVAAGIGITQNAIVEVACLVKFHEPLPNAVDFFSGDWRHRRQ